MLGEHARRTVRAMIVDTAPSQDVLDDQPLRAFGGAPARVVIAGGGVAGLEAMLALRSLARERVLIELIAPENDLVYRPLSVLEPFDRETPRFDVGQIALDHGVKRWIDAVELLDAERHLVRTRTGEEIPYDALIVTFGAEPREVIPGALTFGGDVSDTTFAVLVDEIEHGLVHSVAFALPGGVAWSLPLYELALNLADRATTGDAGDCEFTIVTPEASPLAIFGNQAGEGVRERLEEAGIRLLASTHPVAVDSVGLTIVPSGFIHAERVIALPRLRGRAPDGVPRDKAGFIPTDGYGQVNGVSDIYAAGDCTSFPLKQGGIAAAQADVVAQVIAARVGAHVTPEAFRPQLRGLLLAGDGDIYLSAHFAGGPALNLPVEPLWWPPPKISAPYLAPYLAEHEERLRSERSTRPALR